MSKTRIQWIETGIFHPDHFTDQKPTESWDEWRVRAVEIAMQKWEEMDAMATHSSDPFTDAFTAANRQYLAAAALPAIIRHYGDNQVPQIVASAVEISDALIAELAKKGDSK